MNSGGARVQGPGSRLLFTCGYLDERDAQGLLGHPARDLIADLVDELVGDDKHQQVRILHGLTEIRDSNLRQRWRQVTPQKALAPSKCAGP